MPYRFQADARIKSDQVRAKRVDDNGGWYKGGARRTKPAGQRSGIRCMLRGMKRRRLIVLPIAAGAEQRAMPLFGCFSGTWHDLDARFVAARGGPAQADEVIE
jgi:hypothetical protein